FVGLLPQLGFGIEGEVKSKIDGQPGQLLRQRRMLDVQSKISLGDVGVTRRDVSRLVKRLRIGINEEVSLDQESQHAQKQSNEDQGFSHLAYSGQRRRFRSAIVRDREVRRSFHHHPQ